MNITENVFVRNLLLKNRDSKSHFESVSHKMLLSLKGTLESKTYIVPWDTGLGKTTLLKSFLAEWKAEGFKPSGGALVCFNSKIEIEQFCAESGLEREDYAVYTAGNDFNESFVGCDDMNNAPVLFTTHAMVTSRLSKKSFKKAFEFHYRGAARSLRLWDEGFLPAMPIHLGVDNLRRALGRVRPYNSEWVEGVERFIEQIIMAPVGSSMRVPRRFGDGKQFVSMDGTPPFLTAEERNTISELKQAAGRTLLLMGGKKFGKTLVGAGAKIPADMAPIFVFDASARVTETNRLWASHDDAVEILPSLHRTYPKLTIRLLKEGCGLSLLEQADPRQRLCKAIARVMNDMPEPTLLIGYKSRDAFDLQSDLTDYLDRPELLQFTHWGRHYGTNAFTSTKRLVVLGTYPNRDTSYQALHMAVSGADPATATGKEWIEIRKGELRANLLQAISRGNVRNGHDAECGECVVYLIAPPNPDPEALLRETFPGCVIEEWEPFGIALTGQAKAVFDVINARVNAGPAGVMTKMGVRKAAGIDDRSRFGQVLSDKKLIRALADIGVEIKHKRFVITAISTPVSYIGGLRERWLDKREVIAQAA